MAPTDVLPPKRHAVVERLRRRIENYRRHQNDCIPRFDHTLNGAVEQNLQDTLLLKQRFLESKAKRGLKKSDKKPPEPSLPKFPSKRSASDEVENNNDSYGEAPPSKGQPSNQKQEPLGPSNQKLQQQQQSAPTPQPPPPPPPPQPPPQQQSQQVQQQQQQQAQENMSKFSADIVHLEQCAAALEKEAAANGGSTFPGFSDLIGDDTSDAIITSDAFKDLISEISDFNPEFMKDFDFDGGEGKVPNGEEIVKTEVTIKIENSIIKTENPMGKSPCSSNQRHHIQNNLCAQNKLNFNSGMDFKPELSPAAQTLKHMAEQHQHKTQIGLNFNQSSPVTFSPNRKIPSPQLPRIGPFNPPYSVYNSSSTSNNASGPMIRTSEEQYISSSNVGIHHVRLPFSPGKPPRHMVAPLHTQDSSNWRQSLPQQQRSTKPIRHMVPPLQGTDTLSWRQVIPPQQRPTKPLRHMVPPLQTSDSLSWRQIIPQQQRPQFIQGPGINFSNDTQLAHITSQAQHSTMAHQSMGLHQMNPTMSIRIHMSQNMPPTPVFTSTGAKSIVHRHPSIPTHVYANPNLNAVYPQQQFCEPQQQQQQQQQQPPPQQQPLTHPPSQQQHHNNFQMTGIPPEFSLDFLEQFPAGENSNFTEQEFLNSFGEPGASFNFQDIL